MLTQLQFLKNVNWDEVFSVWKAHEGLDPIWQEFAKKEKGWESGDGVALLHYLLETKTDKA